jgi:hypothetical protein
MKCCICGTVRECGKYLKDVFSNMEQVGNLFDEYVIILYYDDSKDNTLKLMEEYSRINLKFTYHVNNDPLSIYRTHRIAKGRNYCLQQIREKYSNYEYFVVMDCDDRGSHKMKIELLKYYIKNRIREWDSLSFNFPTEYYDTWALSIGPFVASCHHFENSGLGVTYLNNIIKRINKTQLIPCYSAFNGFAIYKTNKFINCEYDGRFNLNYIPKNLLLQNIRFAGKIKLEITRDRIQDCEHRSFHFQAIQRNHAKIRISPLCLFI